MQGQSCKVVLVRESHFRLSLPRSLVAWVLAAGVPLPGAPLALAAALLEGIHMCESKYGRPNYTVK